MASLSKVVISAVDGCVDSVGGMEFTREKILPLEADTYSLKIVGNMTGHQELVLSGLELKTLLKFVSDGCYR